MKVSKGLSTYAGVVGALAGFLLALATFMDTFDQLDPLAGLGPLAAAAGVLWKVIDGRMKQATALAGRPPAAPVAYAGTTSSGTKVNLTLDGAAISRAVNADLDEPGDPDALPDYRTDTDPPPDEGDTSSNGDAGERPA